jgi:ribonuclease PH
VQCERGPLQRADGSARWAQGGSAVLAAVHGPRATAQRKEDPERAVVEVVFRPCSGLAGARPASLSNRAASLVRCQVVRPRLAREQQLDTRSHPTSQAVQYVRWPTHL